MTLFHQNKLKNILTGILILIFGVFIIFTKTQATVAPQVYFTGINLFKNSFKLGEEIQGEVSLWNYEKLVVSDLVFHFQLLDKEIEGVPTEIVDEKIGKEIFTLSPNEKITKSFTYSLPSNLPKGDFKFRVQLATTRGEEMSWIDRIITVEKESKFLILDNYWIVKNGQNLSPGAGVYYQPGEIPEIIFDIANNSDFTITAFPKIITYKRSVGGEIIEIQEGKNIVLEPTQKQSFKTNLPQLEKPETYLSKVRLYDSNTQKAISNLIHFRWIISGQEDAEILFVNFKKDSYQTGETAKAQVKYTGPADFRLEGEKGEMVVQLFDREGNLVGKGKKEIKLKVGQTTIDVPIKKNVNNPRIVTQIIKQKKTLDQYEHQPRPIKKTTKKIEKISFFNQNKKLITTLILIVLIIGIVFYLLKRKKIKLIKALTFLALCGGGILFGNYVLAATEVTGGCCDTTIVFNSPIPDQTFSPGEVINFSGKFKVTGCGNGLFFNKITFYITEDKDIPITDCCGKKIDDCSVAKDCQCQEGCTNCYGATSSNYSSCDFKWCDQVKYLDQTQDYKIYELDTIYPADVLAGAKPYWLEYNQDFIIPEDLEFTGPVRFYVQYSGTHWSSHWHWNITYQKGKINSPPKASISCDPSECGATGCKAYTGCVFHLINNSTDPDGINTITKSEWDILNWGDEPDLSCSEICNFTPPTTLLTPGTYSVRLLVEDDQGCSDSQTTQFILYQEVEADFMYSLDNLNWKDCQTIKSTEGERVYFKDDPSLSFHSIPSEGASSIVSRIWEKGSGTGSNFSLEQFGTDSTASTTLTKEVNTIRLTVTDNNSDGSRKDYQDYVISVELPLPTWEEIPPF